MLVTGVCVRVVLVQRAISMSAFEHARFSAVALGCYRSRVGGLVCFVRHAHVPNLHLCEIVLSEACWSYSATGFVISISYISVL